MECIPCFIQGLTSRLIEGLQSAFEAVPTRFKENTNT